MEKSAALERIADEIKGCDLCKQGKQGLPVAGEGNPDADIVFVGEAPGREEAKTARPFVGRSGKFLRSLIQEIGLKEQDVYITSPVKYMPSRGTPTKADIMHGQIHLMKQLTIIDPKILVLLGSVACKELLKETIQITKHHGNLIELNHRKYLVTYHPAAAIRFPKIKSALIKDFQKIMPLLNPKNAVEIVMRRRSRYDSIPRSATDKA